MGDENRRLNTRVSFQTTADLRFPDKYYEGCETCNLSITGVLVLGVRRGAAGENCDVVLHLSGASSDLMLQMKGEVVRAEEDTVALRFFSIDLDSFYHLKNIVYYNSGDPDLLEKEFESYFLGQARD